MWIYEQKDWPHFTWDSETISTLLSGIRYKQGRLLGRMESLGFDLKLEANLDILTKDVVKTSAIEGAVLNPEEVRSSIAKKLGIDIGGFVSVSRDVEGIVEIMIDATKNYQNPLTQERLFDWHAALFPTGRSGMTKITVGDWRPESAGPMQVVSGPAGREKVHFEAPPANRLNREINEFLLWFETKHEIDPVITAGIAHLWFVTIHPFEDGNGRIARAITDMALARCDNTSDRFYSMSTQIESERKDYYKYLERQQRSTIDITAWLDWFLSCLGRAIINADDSLSSILFKAKVWEWINQKPVNERQLRILNRMLGEFKGHMTTSKYAKITKCSQDTALRDIRELVDRGIFIQNPGGGRSTSYRMVNMEEIPS